MIRKILFALLCFASLNANAQLADSLKKDLLTAPDTVKRLHSKTWTLIPPAAFITYGALSFAIKPVRNVDYFIHGETNKTGPNFHTKAESYFQFAPVALVYGLNLVGISGKNTFIDRTAILALSGGIVGTTLFISKHSTHRLRPNGDDYYSFPSGHTATAFAVAEFMAQEYSAKSPWYGVIGYSFAITTGVFRMYNRDHWFSDVVAGAGVGILSTKAAYLIYPVIRNILTHTDKQGKKTVVMPVYQDGVAGLHFAMQL
ncbi:MAG: phosphatase PAP2 family protein [Mucilaginibacter sp.]